MTLSRVVLAAVLLSLIVPDAGAQCPATFDAPPRYAFGTLLELADFNGDGQLDALTAEETTVRLNAGQRGVFRGGVPVAMPDTPRGSATGDFNGDGKLDVMVGGMFSNAIYFLAGRGDGTFDAPRSITTSVDPWTLHADDLDGDGKLDLIIANLGDVVDVRWGRGDGTFEATPLVFEPAFYPIWLATGDMNEDGRPDIVVGHEQGAITITTINADRTHNPPFRADMRGFVYGMKVADLDGDGHLDVVAADPIQFQVAIFRGKGDGTLHERIDLPGGRFTEGVDLGDFNGDGRLDIVAGQSIEQTLLILHGQPDGTFGGPAEHLAGNNVYEVRVADLDHDGDDDIVTANIDGFSVLLQKGRGEFPQLESYSVGGNLGPYDLITADLNNDGIPEAVTANGLHNTISVFLGTANGKLQEAALYRGRDGAYRVIAAHLNSDDDLDLAIANVSDNSLTILHNRGDGTFLERATYDIAAEPSGLSHGDIDRDGDNDLLVSSPVDGRIDVFLNAGDGSFTPGIAIDARAPGQTVLADLNADGKLDVAIADRVDPIEGVSGYLTIRHGNGDGTFGAATEHPVGIRPIDVVAHDFNRDGQLDFAVANFDSGTVSILLHENGGYRFVNELRIGGQVPHVTVADFDRDGHADVAAANAGSIFIHPGRGNGAFGDPISYRAGNTPFSIAAADFDRDGRIDLATANLVTSDVTILRNTTGCRQRAVRK